MKLYQKIILIGTIVVTPLSRGLVSKDREISDGDQFQDGAYHYLVDDFTAKGLHNLQSPLFDFIDFTIGQVYREAKNSAVPKVVPRDAHSNHDIVNAVESHLAKYGNKSLIIISGAGVHIWGSTNTLEDQFDAEYVSVTPEKLDLGDVIDDEIFFRNETQSERIEKAKASANVQLTRALGVVRHMGYGDLEDYMRDISDFDGAKNIIVGKEETGLHAQYNNQDRKPIYETLTTFIEKFKPTSILYIGESLFSENMRRDFDNGNLTQTDFLTGEPNYRTQFLNRARGLNIPVEFASFGR